MNSLKNRRCKPCEGGVDPLDDFRATRYLDQIPGWSFDVDKKSIKQKFKFKDFVTTMSFVNAIAWMAEQQGHHPDLSVGYGYCEVKYTTHAIGGLSENDFICGALINELLEP